MKISEVKISTRVWMAIIATFLLVALLTGMAITFGQQMYALVDDLYEHPFTVTRAIENAKSDVLNIRADIRAYLLAASAEERAHFIHTMEIAQQDAEAQLAVVARQYLGSQEDVAAALAALRAWEKLRAETMILFSSGQTEQAIQRTTIGGALQQQAADVLEKIDVIVNFAANKASEFKQSARASYESALNRFLLSLAGIAVLLAVVGYWFMRVLRQPLDDLLAATNRLQSGDLSARSSYITGNEFGVLAEAFNEMAATLQADEQVHQGSDALTAALMRSDALQPFCANLVNSLVQLTCSQVGALYLYENKTKLFKAGFTVGLKADLRREFSAEVAEGELGLVMGKSAIQHITQIPPDTKMLFSAVSGEYMPREIITIPLYKGDNISGFVSIASLSAYSENILRFLESIKELISTRVHEVLIIEANRKFSAKLEEQNVELDVQARELASQARVLQAQNAELDTQKRKLDEASRLKSTFLSNMSHELRTPLNSVIALSGVLARRLHGKLGKEEYEYLEVVERNAKHLLTLINDILDLSRIEAGRTEVVLSEFQPAELVDEIITMLKPQAEQKGITLRAEARAGLGSIRTDRAKCLHILQNLVGNAVKFTEKGGVVVSAWRSGELLEIEVKDSGIGISAEAIPFIFDEFRQGDESAARRYEGTGLGLAIAKKYALMLGGDIGVESQPGKGATFTVRLPDLGGQRQAAQHIDAHAKEMAGRSILLVEDNPAAVVQIEDALREYGVLVSTAANGVVALEALEKGCPDAVILDLNLPEMDGFEFLEKLRARKETCRTPVLILSARQVSREELRFLKGNNIYQLVRKGDLDRAELQNLVGKMLADVPKMPAQEQALKPKKGKGEPVILVVENDADNRRVMRALLETHYNVKEAADCADALEAAEKGGIDLVLIDISLPDGDCNQILEKARTCPGFKDVPIIAVTAHAMQGDRERFLAMGFDGYIAKPVDIEVLEKTLQEFLHGS